MSDNSLLANSNYIPLFIDPTVSAHGPELHDQKDVSVKRFRKNISMTEKRNCYQCGKDAIGCSYLNVCEDHADSHILALGPGEKQSVGESCFFERFNTADT
jgi:hypothetical protein